MYVCMYVRMYTHIQGTFAAIYFEGGCAQLPLVRVQATAGESISGGLSMVQIPTQQEACESCLTDNCYTAVIH